MIRACSPLLLAAALLGGALTAQVPLQGAGATFPYPLYSKWISEYQKVNPTARVDYQSIGSGGGIKQITEQTVDFGATDTPMTADEKSRVRGTLHHLPVTLGAVVLAYNVPGVATGLKLDPATLAGIFLGQIRVWNDPRIAGLNPGVKLPATPISIAYRSDGSGTTAVFTEYLAKVSVDWKAKVGAGKSVKFPAGMGAKGNEGVTGQVKTTPGGIGYVELAYAHQNNLAMVSLRNRAGKFIAPSAEGVTAAASGNQMPADLCLSLSDGVGARDYPIAAFSYLLVYQDQKNAAKGKVLADFLWWAIHDGQKFAAALDYAPLPRDVLPKVEARVRGLTSGGKTLLNK
jgi:phosphate transport system substrate-binding protein